MEFQDIIFQEVNLDNIVNEVEFLSKVVVRDITEDPRDAILGIFDELAELMHCFPRKIKFSLK